MINRSQSQAYVGFKIDLQGITKANEHVEDALQMIKLWTHEVLRVFYDRLVDDHDRLFVGQHLSEIIKLHFKEKVGSVAHALMNWPQP